MKKEMEWYKNLYDKNIKKNIYIYSLSANCEKSKS